MRPFSILGIGEVGGIGGIGIIGIIGIIGEVGDEDDWRGERFVIMKKNRGEGKIFYGVAQT